MDPLSITASIITVLQATGQVVSICYDYAAAAKGSSWALSRVIDELKGLRSVLESLEQLSTRVASTDPATRWRLPTLTSLCDPEHGALASCLKELKDLREKLSPLAWASHEGSRRKALVQFKSTLGLALATDQATLTQAIQETQKSEFQSLNKALSSKRDEERYQKILQWLSAPDPSLNYNSALKKRHVNTGAWLTRSEQFKEWKKAQDSLLWLHGIPGCGKTVLASTAIEDVLKHDDKTAVAYFYFDFNDHEKQFSDKMIRSLLSQLSSFDQSIPAALEALFSSHQDVTEGFERVFIVLDALDECEDRQVLLSFIDRLLDWKSGELRVMATSRREKDIEDFFKLKLDDENMISIQNEKVDEDIRSYVHGKLKSDRRFQRWQKQPKVQEEIENKLMEKADGMFRWAACQLDALCTCLNLKRLREALNCLPVTLDETYERILCKIDPQYQREVHQILQWLSYSLRPLRLEEVAEIVAFDVNDGSKFDVESRFPEPGEILTICSSLVTTSLPNTDDDDNEIDDDDTEISDEESSDEASNDEGDNDEENNEEISEYESTENGGTEYQDNENCTASFKSRSKTTLVRLAHFSVKEYLTSKRIKAGSASFYSIEEKIANAVIAEISLSCLLQFDRSLFLDPMEFSRKYPLAKYAAEYWNKHALVNERSATRLAMALFLDEEKSWNWIYLHDLDVQIERFHISKPDLLGGQLYYAVLTGSFKLVKQLIEFNAAKGTHAEVSSIVLSKNLTDTEVVHAPKRPSAREYVNEKGGRYHTALQVASLLGREDVANLLIERGADPNIYGGRSPGSALSHAAKGSKNIVELLLKNGADVNEGLDFDLVGNEDQAGPDNDDTLSSHQLPSKKFHELAERDSSSTGSQRASANENEEVATTMSIKGLRLNSDDKDRTSALHSASENGNAGIVKLLLERGAAVDMRSGSICETALSAASVSGHEEIVQILLDNGADVDKTDKGERSPLYETSFDGRQQVVSLLLKYGANANLATMYKSCPLHGASSCGSEKVVSLLLKHGADVNKTDWREFSSLSIAARRGHEQTVSLLLKHGADVNIDALLMEALRSGKRETARILIENGAKINMVRDTTETYYRILWAHWPDTFEALSLIRRHLRITRADLGRKMAWKETPLFIASATGCEQSVTMLLDKGATVNETGVGGLTPLQIATEEGHTKVVDVLLAAGADKSFLSGDLECPQSEERGRPLLLEYKDGSQTTLSLLSLVHEMKATGKRKKTSEYKTPRVLRKPRPARVEFIPAGSKNQEAGNNDKETGGEDRKV